MPISPAYTLASTLCPPLAVASSTLIVPGTTTPPISPVLATGDVTAVATKSKQQMGNLDVVARYGGGAYAIATGLALSDGGGLVCNVSAGQAFLDGPATLASAGTVALADNAYNWLYILPDGTLTKTSSASTTVPAAPNSGLCVFLGRVTTLSAAITAIDYSGRPELGQGNIVLIQTADTDKPTWTPTAGIRFRHNTANGAKWDWDGSTYSILNAYPLTYQAVGVLTSSQVLGWRVVDRAVTLPVSLAGSAIKAQVAATGSTVLTIKKNNSTTLGTLTFAASGTVPTISFAAAVSLVSGDVVSVHGPGTADATLADVAITLRGLG